MTFWKNLVVALVAAFALAACSSSNDNGGMTDMQGPQPMAMAVDTSGVHDDATVEAFSATIHPGMSTTRGDVTYSCPSSGDACMVEVMADGTTTSTGGAATAANSDTFQALLDTEGDLDDAVTDRDALQDQMDLADQRAAAAKARLVFAAIDTITDTTGNTPDPTGSLKVTATYGKKPMLGASSTFDTDGNGPASPHSVTKRKWTSTTGTREGSWSATDFMANSGKDHVRVYNNVGANKNVPFGKWLMTASSTGEEITSTIAADTNVITLVEAALTGNPAHVASPMFNTASGTTTHTPSAGTENQISGTFGGAQGTYFCTGGTGTPCTSRPAAEGVTLAGAWSFQASATAMATVANTDHTSFGWWLHKDINGNYHLATFTDPSAATMSTGIETLTGSAKYMGKASGKYAVYPGPMAGAFTADVTLDATFGADAEIGGVVDNFTGGDDMGDWRVTLPKRTLSDTGATDARDITDLDQTLPVWSIGDAGGDPAGEWSGQMYNNIATGNPRVGTPQEVLGTFSAEHGPTARMAGAFGAELQ